jgi:drug/metabolite transporter (DMT)-like permease
MVAWSFNFVTVKTAIAAVPPVGFAFVRFLLAGLVLLAITRRREGSVGLPRRVAVRVALLGGLGFGLYQLLCSWSRPSRSCMPRSCSANPSLRCRRPASGSS